MKKVLFALALLASVTFASAQNVKTENAAKAALEKAQAAANNAKQATKVATWLKLATSYMDAYNAPMGNGWIGAQAQELQLVMAGQRRTSEENVTINGTQYLKKAYASADYYFNEAGQLSIIKVTKPIVENALDKALDAYKNAYKNDPKGTKTADIIKGIEGIAEKYVQEAYDAYTFGDFANASKLFETAANALGTAPCNKADDESLYNAGFSAWAGQDLNRAKSLFQTCIDHKYYGDDGDVFAKLADVTEKLGDKEAAKDILEQGFAAYPSSQAILIGLINYYVSSNQDTDRLFSLLNDAKKNEPDNASLYYVEGNINKELGKIDDALAAYRKCAEINPNYEYGYIGEGLLLYNQAYDIQEEAQAELDDAKYMALVEKFEAALKGCIAPFEKALEVTKDESLKPSIAEYLKNACYRFREDADFGAKYEKYNAMVAAATE
ncbi:MAG: tetratricopeptide repeat protein [Bacteroidales bacterium]|nr:tetratricopeptide repeat protein [Bacteroidales bacterium]